MDGHIRCLEYSSAEIPTYRLGPFVINGKDGTREQDIYFSCTETPNIPSINRGRKVINLAGGSISNIISDEMTRAPLITTPSNAYAREIVDYIGSHWENLKIVADSSTSYGRLRSINPLIHKSDIYLRIGMFTADAAGHNMTEKAAHAIVDYITENFPDARLVAISSNYCTDKKAALVNKTNGRGKHIQMSVEIPHGIVEEYLKTTSEKIHMLNEKKNITGSRLAGSIGQNAHHANIVSAVYLATGQDIANVVEGSIGDTKTTLFQNVLLFSVDLPAIIVGTIGGGTSLDYAKKHLVGMRCYGSGDPPGANSTKLAESVGAAVLAGELSLMAALTNGDELLKTHLRLER